MTGDVKATAAGGTGAVQDQAGSAQETDGPRIGDLLRLLRGSGRTVVAALVLTVTGTVVGLFQPLLTMRLIDRVSAHEAVASLVVALTALFLAQAALEAGGQYLLDATGESVVRRLRRRLVERLMFVRIQELDGRRTGDLLSRVGTDTTVLRDMVAGSFVQLVTVGVTGVGAAGLMIWIDPVMFLMVAATLVVAAVLVAGVMAGIRSSTEQALAGVGAMTADLERVLGGIRTVRAARAERREAERIGADVDTAYTAGLRSARLGSVVGPAMEIAVNGSFLLVLLIGAVRVSNGSMTVSELVAFLLFATYLVMPLAGLFNALSLIQRGLGSLGRIEDVLGLPVEEVTQAPATPPAASSSTLLDLRNVTFSYGERPVLRDVSFTVPRTGIVALVGRSGAGKSTIVSLVEKFYEPDGGHIAFDGTDIRDVDPRAHRARIGLVEQHAPLLHGTLRDNLVYATPAADEESIRETLRMVNLEELVERLPDGLRTEVGDRGFNLSGGERQRVAIARALLGRPHLLLLDEPTSQLDLINEREITEMLRKISRKHALLVVAHRMSTVRAADRIVVLDDGRVSAMGTHEQLLTDEPFYRRLTTDHLKHPDADRSMAAP
ncbi:ABC transporter ATP-binding protein [Streptomyces ipomoeae]|uniref:ABC transporter, ATP-binding protein n=1 Tax=Streptomyces ipomoeae 91-03 TaxID=698759 RepID=L1L4W0_9ACTN|nr:ABC transporter ATP-binding protein [Streptomyces ipomoeae]EKX67804.1 ABC transporter, ATP-binding protein [Streptomyces ipomoeae 91-03]MDX2692325.1 ABC transporter ATP-binding protein [Streptomyces ipomoeae]MDX2819971.1 ABC transporter ATP-binding protein [Streptomyces ipomoeae]MDX2837845.1 ABC transporter ATP-binding protein [Streptomyces ipomoeae]MDX2872490.1 ABC transporter ATP-binding protein [Streptomyces ipomoeae]